MFHQLNLWAYNISLCNAKLLHPLLYDVLLVLLLLYDAYDDDE